MKFECCISLFIDFHSTLSNLQLKITLYYSLCVNLVKALKFYE